MTFEGGEGDDTTQFLATFRSLCDNADIINPQEIKNRLLRTYSTNEFFKNEFSRRTTAGVTNIDEIYRLYSDIVSDSSKLIKYGPEWLIAIKHRETGKYLSSCKINYETGSKRQMVYAGEKIHNENIWWYLTCETPVPQKKTFQENKVLYDDVVYLTHNKTKDTLSLSDFYKSPVTNNAEVHGFPYSYTNLRFVKTNETNEQNNSPYLKVRDGVNIKTDTDYILRSQDVSFKIEDKLYQEVVGHKEKVSRNDEWIIEKK
jgi:dolichyl-phosphate-mannose--protein O-mannosyl transferase